MPISKALWQATPFAAMLGYVQHGINDLQIGHTDIAALPWHTVLDECELLGCDLHAQQYQSQFKAMLNKSLLAQS